VERKRQQKKHRSRRGAKQKSKNPTADRKRVGAGKGGKEQKE
jgi:hypothetical protein